MAKQNHFERNHRSRQLLSRFQQVPEGMPAIVWALTQPDYAKELAFGLAASLADVSAAMAVAENGDYSTVYYAEPAQRFVMSLAGMAEKAGLATSAKGAAAGQFAICYHMLNYQKHGKHTFRVSDGLAMLLALTELRGLRCEDLKLPFPSLYLEVPETLNFRIYNSMTGWHTVEGLYLSEDNSDSTLVPQAKPDGKRSWRVCVVGKDNENSIDKYDDALVYFSIPLIEGTTVDEALKVMADRVHFNSKDDSALREEQTDSLTEWTAIFRWAMNVMVYATTPDAEHDVIRDNEDAESIWRRIQKLPKISKKRDDLKAKLKGMDQQFRDLYGKSVKVTPALRSMFEHRQQGAGKPLMVRTLVSGHWMRFAVGEGRKERVWKFRQPFWRGPDSAPEAQSHVHVFSE